MKLIVKIAIGVIIGLFVMGTITMCAVGCGACTAGNLLFDDDTEEVDDEFYEDDEDSDYYEDADDDSDEESSEDYESDDDNSNSNDNFYDNAVDDDKASAASNWGDGTVREITSAQFYSLVAKKSNKGDYIGNGPCVVDFWASWCGYCKQIAPYMTRLAKQYKGKVQFYKVNADNCTDVASLYGIESLPTVFFCSGSDIEVTTGALSESEYQKKVKALI